MLLFLFYGKNVFFGGFVNILLPDGRGLVTVTLPDVTLPDGRGSV